MIQKSRNYYRWTKSELEYLYLKQNLTINEIAREYDTSDFKVRYWLIKFEIPRESSQKIHSELVARLPRKELIKKYSKEGKTLHELGKEYNVSHESIRYYMKKLGINRRTPWKINHFNFDRMDKNLAYIFGVRFGDGWLEKNRFSLRVKDKEFSNAVFEAFKHIGLEPIYKKDTYHKKMYLLRVNSKEFYLWISKVTVDKLADILTDSNLKIAFIRGFYDSEGCLYRDKRGFYHLSIYNTNIRLIQLVRIFLTEFKFNPHSYKSKIKNKKVWIVDHYAKVNKIVYNLRLERQNEIKKFCEIIEPNIPRKRR